MLVEYMVGLVVVVVVVLVHLGEAAHDYICMLDVIHKAVVHRTRCHDG
jgi:hypothetical protein